MLPARGCSSPRFVKEYSEPLANGHPVPTYMSHRQYQVINRPTPYIHTYREEHPLSQLVVCFEQRVETPTGNSSSQSAERQRTEAYINISFDNGSWSGSEGSNSRRKGTPGVYGVTADIGINLSGVVGDRGISGTALSASNASVNQRWKVNAVHSATHNEPSDIHSPDLCRDSQASPGS
jgi:hypothetical protein